MRSRNRASHTRTTDLCEEEAASTDDNGKRKPKTFREIIQERCETLQSTCSRSVVIVQSICSQYVANL